MSDTEDYFEQLEQDEAIIQESTKKSPKKKRVLSEEQKKRNVENLRRGREKALINRRKKAEIKKLEKEQIEKELDKRLNELKGVKPVKQEIKPVENIQPDIPIRKVETVKDNDVFEELKRLREEINTLKIKPESSKPIEIPKQEVAPVKQQVAPPPVKVITPPRKIGLVPIRDLLNSMYNI